MKSLERVLTTLSHREPDRVPLFLLVTMHGAKELGLSIREYFSKAEYVVEGVPTTIPLHLAIFDHTQYIKGQVDTNFIESYFGK